MQLSKYTEHIILSFALITLAQLAYALHSGVFSGQLVDPDCYTWLVRATQFHETRLWFDATLYRVDPPYGLEQHWTRPFDVLLVTGAWALTPFIGFESGLYAWGVLISPILMIVSVLFLIWGFAPVYNRRQLLFLALGFIVMPAIFFTFLAGRSDHHSLITLFYIITLGFLMRMMLTPEQKKWSWGAGFFSALGFWVCIELGVFIILPIIVFFSILWFLKEKNSGLALFNYSASLLIFSTCALLIENGFSEFFRPEVDRLSIIFVLFFALVVLYSIIVQKFDFFGKTTFRLIFAGAAAFGILAVMKGVYPQVFSGSEIDPLYRALRSANLAQDKPIYTLEWPGGLISFLFWAGIIIPVSLWFMYSLFARKWWHGLFTSPRKETYVKISLFVLVCLVLYKDYVFAIRYVVYLQFVLLLGYVVFMDNVVKYIEFKLNMSKLLPVVRPLAMFVMLTWFYYPIALPDEGDGSGAGHNANMVSASRFIHEITRHDERPLNIMAAPEPGSSLLYFTRNNVFSIPNHRCKQGFRDWYHILSAETDEKAHSIVLKREVDMILINKSLDRTYLRYIEENTFMDRLLAEKEVSWLKRIEAPDTVPKDIFIYLVVQQDDLHETHHTDTLLQ